MSMPVEVDTRLAELRGKWQALTIKRRDLSVRAAQVRQRDPRYADLLCTEAGALHAEILSVEGEMVPLEELYNAQRWNRAFVVPDGHVHRSMGCSTCYPTTEFHWVTEMSGKDEAEIVEAAGSRACTVCYPSAPVDAPASRILHPTEVAAEKARQARAAKKAEDAAKKAANAIEPFRTREGDTLRTVYAAKQYLTDGFEYGWSRHPSFPSADRDAVAALLAAKLGTTPETELEAAERRARNR